MAKLAIGVMLVGLMGHHIFDHFSRGEKLGKMLIFPSYIPLCDHGYIVDPRYNTRRCIERYSFLPHTTMARTIKSQGKPKLTNKLYIAIHFVRP